LFIFCRSASDGQMTSVTRETRLVTPAPPLHPDVEVIAFLLGEWHGEGHGAYPTIESFGYRDEIVFGHTGKPFLSYAQRTWLADGSPSHTEVGYLRAQPEGRVELVVAQPGGRVEVDEGAQRGGRFELTSVVVANTSSAKEVTETRRLVEVDGDVMRYELEMAAVGQPRQFHLEAELRRS
jgi:THAP4-like, heme-binding beta-barrel domain